MGIRKEVTWESGVMAEFHAIENFSMDTVSGDCLVAVSSYPSEMDADYRTNKLCTHEFSCDFIVQGGDVYNQIYASLLTKPVFVAGTVFGLVDVSGYAPRDKPEQPSVNHTWDSATETWSVTPARFAEIKAEARERITTARNTEESAGFTAYGKVFDSDSAALQRISVVALAAKMADETFSIDWTCADNSVITLSKAQFSMLPAIMAQAANALHIKARALKAQIDAASSLEEIEAVQW